MVDFIDGGRFTKRVVFNLEWVQIVWRPQIKDPDRLVEFQKIILELGKETFISYREIRWLE